MASIGKAVLFGFLLWLIPFVIAFAIFPLRMAGDPFFETIMPITLTICVVSFSILYLNKIDAKHLSECVKLGVMWFAMSFLIDLSMFTWGPMAMPFVDYVKDIGLTYLIYPTVTIGFGMILERHQKGSVT